VPNPELILRRGRSFQGQTSKPGIKSNPLSHSKESKDEKTDSSSSKIISEKSTVTTAEGSFVENISVEQQIVSYQEENVIAEEVIGSNLVEEASKSLERNHNSSSLESFHSQQEEDHINIHTNLLVVEHILQELSAKGEEKLAEQLANFYIASYQTSFPSESSPPFQLNPPSVEESEKILSPLSPIVIMVAPPPLTKMQRILAARYAPLVLPNQPAAMPTGDYQKYMPKFTREGDVTAEEHIEAFYSYAENLNIEDVDVWTRVFVQSLDGHARKWFKELPAGSVAGIEELDDVFLKHWGDRRDFLYYITEFGNLKKENGESVSDFTKRFNRMYSKIPAEIKPTETSAQITYANSFDSEFCLLLRERRSATLSLMQDVALEVESNILAAHKLKGNVDRKRQKEEASSSSFQNPKIDKLAKMLESLTSEMSKLKIENKQPAKGKGSYEYPHRNPNQNPNTFRRNNQQTQILRRERNPTEDQKVRAPLQNTVMDEDEDDFQEEEEDNIHCVGDDAGKSYLTQHDYEEALMTEQINEISADNGVFQTDDGNKYNLRSKSNTAKQSTPAPPSKKIVAPAKQQTQKDQVLDDQPIALKTPSKENAPAPPPKKTAAPAKQQIQKEKIFIFKIPFN
jgi:hypothetical protein